MFSKKGLSMAWGSILAMSLIATFVVIYMTQAEPVQTASVINSGKIIAFANDVQIYKKMIPESIPHTAGYSVYKSAKSGGGFGTWGLLEPSIDQIKTNLQEQINIDFPEKIRDNDLTISLKDGDFIIDSFTDNSIKLKSEKTIVLANSALASFSSSKINLDTELKTTYFKLMNIGRGIVESQDYIISEGSFVDNGDNTFTIINSGDECLNLEAKNAVACDGTYCTVKVNNLIKKSIQCGYKNNIGVKNIADAPTTEERIISILDSLKTDLSARHAMEVELYQTYYEDVGIKSVKVEIKITDQTTSVNLPDNKKEPLTLIFSTELTKI